MRFFLKLKHVRFIYFFFHQFIFFPLIFISWRLITLQYCSGFCYTLTWISRGFTCVPIPISPSASLPIPSLWVFPVHQPWALVSCIQPGLVICFTLDNIRVSMLFSQNIPPSLDGNDNPICKTERDTDVQNRKDEILKQNTTQKGTIR